MRHVHIGRRTVGPGHPTLIAAEIGINHNGDMVLAREMIAAAAEAGADAVKFQNYRTEDFLSDERLTYAYESQGRTVVESQYAMFKRCELSQDQLFTLRDACDRAHVLFFSTPTGEDGLADLVACGARMVKNGSDYLTHLPLIRAMARSGLVTVLSTGMSTEEEVTDAVQAFHDAGGRELVLLHCTSSYPTPDSDVNLRRVPALGARFDVPSGFSDHTWGDTAAIGAVALGACFVEKHFTLDKGLPGPDHRFSSDPAELRSLVAGIRRMEAQLGTPGIGPAPSEAVGRRDYRLSCVARDGLPAGHRLTAQDIAFRRPGNGIPPKHAEHLVGRILRREVGAGDILHESDLT
jgi:N-acetylneuraminate synthase/N,N'-diacetyllegionaminate synthase